jgi:hypothetical protein
MDNPGLFIAAREFGIMILEMGEAYGFVKFSWKYTLM